MAAEALLIRLEEDDVSEDAEQAWVDELERRVSVAAEGIGAEDVFAEGRDRLRNLS